MGNNYTLNCKGLLLDLSTPKVMGILNLTPDSFYDGGTLQSEKDLIQRAGKMLSEGAAILDIGGQSTRPSATTLSVEEEWSRVEPALQAIAQEFPNAILSIDTFYAEIAQRAISEGAAIVNDVSGGDWDGKMFETIAKLQVPYILMHALDKPDKMQAKPEYTDVVNDIVKAFSKKINQLSLLGINDVVIDPGFGFGKTKAQNFTLLKRLAEFCLLECPLLVGLSRKSMLYKPLEIDAADALNATTAAHIYALQGGTNILRVHDVKEATEAIEIFSFTEAAC